jgi:hypothetical protein
MGNASRRILGILYGEEEMMAAQPSLLYPDAILLVTLSIIHKALLTSLV